MCYSIIKGTLFLVFAREVFMADPKKLKSRNVDDYICNVDEKVIKEQGRPVMYVVVALVVIGLGLAGFAYFGSNKQPEQTYAELVAEKPKPTQAPVQKTETTEKTSFFSGLFGLTSKKSEKSEFDRNAPIYTTAPSNEIIEADPLSGSVQVGDYLFVLPCELRAFTDVGFELVGWASQSTNSYFAPDAALSARLGRQILIRGDEHSVYAVELYNNEEVALIDATVVSVSQASDASYFDPQAKPIFVPGGIHVGSAEEEVDNYYSQFEEYKVSKDIGYRIYNGPIMLDIAPNNFIVFSSNPNIGELYGVRIYKNR